MKIYKCDKCNRQVRKPSRIQIKGEQSDAVIMMLQKIDLCEQCYKQIYGMIDDFVTYKS